MRAPRAAVARLIIGPIEALFALPKITLVPLFILWMGIGALQHIAFTALVVFFFFFFAMFNGVRGIPAALTQHADARRRFARSSASPFSICRRASAGS